ncbi:MAG: hypothetical protein IIA67_02425 [Planctomycetes bacterium]|nr:hypothetical protein [Planctomycetota bacterium]
MLREAVWQAEVVLRQSVLPAEALLRSEAQEVLRPEAQDVLCQEEVLLPHALRLRPVRRPAWHVLLWLPLEVRLRCQTQDLLRPQEDLLRQEELWLPLALRS